MKTLGWLATLAISIVGSVIGVLIVHYIAMRGMEKEASEKLAGYLKE